MGPSGLRRGLALLALLAGPAIAADPAGDSSPAGSQKAPPPAPSVGLDSLLKLPSNHAPVEQRTGGVTRQEWEERFAAARADVATAQEGIDKTQREMGEVAGGGSSWQMSAPGGGSAAGGENSPVSFRLRQELRRQREELASAEKRLTELEVEANLAGVPEEWMKAPEVAPAPRPSASQ